MMNDSQKAYATKAMDLVSPCIDFFLKNYPCLRDVVDGEELESAALFACANAATTYDPKKSGISAYFSRAIIHELLKSCRRELRSQSRSIYRISLKAVEGRQPAKRAPLADAASEALSGLSETDQAWIQAYVVEEQSIRQMSLEKGVTTRQVRKLLAVKLSKLRKATSDQPHWHDPGCP